MRGACTDTPVCLWVERGGGLEVTSRAAAAGGGGGGDGGDVVSKPLLLAWVGLLGLEEEEACGHVQPRPSGEVEPAHPHASLPFNPPFFLLTHATHSHTQAHEHKEST